MPLVLDNLPFPDMNKEIFCVYSFSNIFQVVMDWAIAYQKEHNIHNGTLCKMHTTIKYISCKKANLFFIFY